MAEAGAEEKPLQDDTLPQGWEAHTSRSTGEVYYYNTFTEETTYDRPTEPAGSADLNPVLVQLQKCRRRCALRSAPPCSN